VTPRILVVFKKSSFQIYVEEHGDEHVRDLVRRRSPAVANLLLAHREHELCLATVRRTIERMRLRVTYRYRSRKLATRGFDLVVTVGGDGTLLEAARSIESTPVLSVNSSPSRSIAAFSACAATTFGDCLAEYLAGRARVTALARLAISIDEPPQRERALNDALFCHRNPGAMSRYQIAHGGRSEEQRSSGVWVATPCGSTAGIRSAGGQIAPLRSPRLQFRVRELFCPPNTTYHLTAGFVAVGETLELVSEMRQGVVFVDGPHRVLSWSLGAKAIVSRDATPLNVVGIQEKRRRQFGLTIAP
jgi:NAD+ kinase